VTYKFIRYNYPVKADEDPSKNNQINSGNISTSLVIDQARISFGNVVKIKINRDLYSKNS
jgi:hypothetical protein